MAKKQKTKKQKMASDQRRHSDNTYMQSISIKKETDNALLSFQAPVSLNSKNTIAISDYKYLSKDLLKTALLTISIVVVELIIKQIYN